jgi:hypothetical protein
LDEEDKDDFRNSSYIIFYVEVLITLNKENIENSEIYSISIGSDKKFKIEVKDPFDSYLSYRHTYWK